MVNNIGKIFEINDGSKYIVSKQAIYKNDNYYVLVRVTDDESDLTEEVKFLKEVINGDTITLEPIEDEKLLKLIFKNLDLLEKE